MTDRYVFIYSPFCLFMTWKQFNSDKIFYPVTSLLKYRIFATQLKFCWHLNFKRFLPFGLTQVKWNIRLETIIRRTYTAAMAYWIQPLRMVSQSICLLYCVCSAPPLFALAEEHWQTAYLFTNSHWHVWCSFLSTYPRETLNCLIFRFVGEMPIISRMYCHFLRILLQ